MTRCFFNRGHTCFFLIQQQKMSMQTVFSSFFFAKVIWNLLFLCFWKIKLRNLKSNLFGAHHANLTNTQIKWRFFFNFKIHESNGVFISLARKNSKQNELKTKQIFSNYFKLDGSSINRSIEFYLDFQFKYQANYLFKSFWFGGEKLLQFIII